MKKLSILTSLLLCPISASAMTAFDTRSVGMGGTGVASANFLTSSFHNPALAAKDQENHGFGFILPMVGARVHDGNDTIDKIDTFIDLDDELQFNPNDQQLIEEWRQALRAVDNGTVNVEANVGMAIAIPNSLLSTNFFTKGQLTTIAVVNVDDRDLANNDPSKGDIYSSAQAVGGAVLDVGFTFAREVTLGEHAFLLGISPKFQQIYALNYVESLREMEDGSSFDWEDNYTEKSAFNLDLGVSYDVSERVNVGFSARNLISQELLTNETLGETATFLVEPEYVLGVNYDRNWVRLAADFDLTSKKYLKEFDYKTQYARFGAEFDAWGWAQLRTGYMLSMTDHADDLVSLGLGFRPWGVLGLDIAAQMGSDNNYGVSAQIAFTY
ncbi:conjugal transfer protein TraF [uncultured Vibrio sp.]|uniref:conjugal transfer protein TraF n=1 Tax=uncultured Vibrio sp. TaxID=114054 RepID=UPI0025D1A9DD|nr:conjugal transfer protein TraF [uncultured Vibrio sp.]